MDSLIGYVSDNLTAGHVGLGVVSGVWWDDCVDGYLRALARRNRRPETLRTYRAELRMFGAWLDLHSVKGAAAVTRDHIETWQDELRVKRSANTQLVAAAALRGLLRWAVDRELGIGPSLWLRVTSPAVPVGLPRPIPAKDLLVLQTAFDRPTPGDQRQLCLRALFWVILSSGARISEALSLPRHALDEGSAMVTQKGGRPHLMVISRKARQAVEDWEEARDDSCWAMFPSPKREGLPARRGEIQQEWDR